MKNKPKDVVIVQAVRTPIGTYKGSLKNLKADQLGSVVISEVLKRSKINREDIDEVITKPDITKNISTPKYTPSKNSIL